MNRTILKRDFFERPSDIVARELLGTVMVVYNAGEATHVRIIETEAYGGFDDPASHAFRGPTKRSAIMFEAPGHLYVYRSYGIHWCMNVVTERTGVASAVLLRAGLVLRAVSPRVSPDASSDLLRGPGILTRELGISGADNGVDCCQETSARINFEREGGPSPFEIGVSPRVGISRGQERMSRYFIVLSPSLSKRVPKRSS